MATQKKGSYDGQSAEDRALDKFAELMIEKIKSMQQDWQKPWLSPGAKRWPVNIDGRRYCGSNALMLMLQSEKMEYDTPIWATFNRITALNYKTDKDGNRSQALGEDGQPLPTVTINKGAKSMPVFLTSFTVVDKETKQKIPYEEYRKMSDEQKKGFNVYAKLNVFNVFNLSAQTNLAEARPELLEKLKAKILGEQVVVKEGEKFHLPVIDQMIEKQAWHCPIELNDGDNCYYSISQDKVVMPKAEYFKTGESFISTLAHEMSHSTGSANRFNRLKAGTTFGDANYSKEELTAELSAALICSRLGITKHLKDDSAAYLKSWLEHMQESPEYIKTVLNDVKRASSMVNIRLENIQAQIDKHQQLHGPETYPDRYDLDYLPFDIILPFEETMQETNEMPFKRGR